MLTHKDFYELGHSFGCQLYVFAPYLRQQPLSWAPSEWLSRQQCACSKAYQLWISLSTGNRVLCTAFLLIGKLYWDTKTTLWIWIYYSLDRWDFCLGRVELNCCGLQCSWNKNKGSDAMLCWSLTGVTTVLRASPVSPHALDHTTISPQTLQSRTSLGKWIWKIYKSLFHNVKRISELWGLLLTQRTVSHFLKAYSNFYSLFCSLDFNKVYVKNIVIFFFFNF